MSGIVSAITSLFSRRVAEVKAEHAPDQRTDADDVDEGDYPGGEKLIMKQGTQYILLDGTYQRLCDPNEVWMSLELVNGTKNNFAIVLYDCNGDQYWVQDVAEGLQVTYHYRTGSVHWCAQSGETGDLDQYAFCMDTPNDAKAFIEAYNVAAYTNLTGGTLDVSALPTLGDEDEYCAAQFTTEVPMDIEEETGVEPGQADEEPPVYDNPMFATDVSTTTRMETGPGENRCFADSMVHNAAVVLQANGSKGKGAIARVFRYDENGFVNETPFQFDVKNLTPGNASTPVIPKESRLIDNDTKMVVVDENDASRLLAIDMARGEVVQEFRPGVEGINVISATPLHKNGEDPSLVACLHSAAAYTMDMRLDPSKAAVVESGKDVTSYQHTLKNYQKFACHATSAAGHLAIGDRCGGIRLFSGPPGSRRAKGHHPKAAKTMLKAGPNTPILDIDITADGEFIVATTEKCLIVLSTRYMDGENRVANGFESRMGKKKPLPLRLELSPQQRKGMGPAGKVATFTKACFQGTPAGEQFIAATCGSCVLMWSMKRIRRAIESHRTVLGDLKDEGGPLKSVAMQQREQLTYMSEKDIGMETYTERTNEPTDDEPQPRRGKRYVSFQR